MKSKVESAVEVAVLGIDVYIAKAGSIDGIFAAQGKMVRIYIYSVYWVYNYVATARNTCSFSGRNQVLKVMIQIIWSM